MDSTFLNVSELNGVLDFDVFLPSFPQPELVKEVQNLQEIEGNKDKSQLGVEEEEDIADLLRMDGKFNFDGLSDEELTAASPQSVIPQSQIGGAATLVPNGLEMPITMEQIRQVTDAELISSLVTGNELIPEVTTVPQAVEQPKQVSSEEQNSVENNAKIPMETSPPPAITQAEEEESKKPKASKRRAPKRKKYMEDPTKDETGTVKNAINAKINREKKKKEWADLVQRAETAESKLQEKEKIVEELSTKLQLAEEEKARLALRAAEAETKLAKHRMMMSQVYSEVCLDIPKAASGSKVNQQNQI